MMIEVLHDIGIDGKDVRIVRNLHWKQKATVQLGERKTEWIGMRREWDRAA